MGTYASDRDPILGILKSISRETYRDSDYHGLLMFTGNTEEILGHDTYTGPGLDQDTFYKRIGVDPGSFDLSDLDIGSDRIRELLMNGINEDIGGHELDGIVAVGEFGVVPGTIQVYPDRKHPGFMAEDGLGRTATRFLTLAFPGTVAYSMGKKGRVSVYREGSLYLLHHPEDGDRVVRIKSKKGGATHTEPSAQTPIAAAAAT
ncbi:MAG: hypothetical protein ACXABY_19665 [Candidatus Thorarchaeota archaeon]|jgi:hypothetical protein